jgi:dihydrofolate synthase/folylpolyglutamate synthase
MAKVRFPARMERLHKTPPVLLDGAHNPSGAATLADSIKRYLKEKPVLIMGMLADKDYFSAISVLAPLAKAFLAIRPESPRALDPSITAQTAAQFCNTTAFYEDYEKAFSDAVKMSCGAPIIVCGSLYLAAKMRNVIDEYFKKI